MDLPTFKNLFKTEIPYRKARFLSNWVCMLAEDIGKWGVCPPVVELV